MTLDAVRARRHAMMLDRIADERSRAGRLSRKIPRVRSERNMVVRDSNDGAGGSPAVISRIGGISIDNSRFYDPYVPLKVTVLQKVVHKSGPILGAEAYGPDDVGRDGMITLNRVNDA